MTAVTVRDFASWRAASRELLTRDVAPQEVVWSAGLFESPLDQPGLRNTATVPREFLKLAEVVVLHRDERRWALLYRVLWRVTHGEHNLLKISIDDDVRELTRMNKSVQRDMHKMKAFVRFRRIDGIEPEQFVAWHKPDHRVLEAVAPWFADRFAPIRWSILTPDKSAHWDLEKLTYGPGLPQSEAPSEDGLEDLWRDYYAAVFNPARVNVKAMKAKMPVRHWATLPKHR